MTNYTPVSFPVYWHPAIALHDLHAQHVAMGSERLSSLACALLAQEGATLVEAPHAQFEDLALAHDEDYLQELRATQGLQDGEHHEFDSETRLNRHTWEAISRSAGAAVHATRQALTHRVPFSFCVTYAGHHARHASAAGFCFINNVAVAAHCALKAGVSRLAVLDIDTHAGDGTALSVLNLPQVLFAETYQPGFPGAFLPASVRPGIERRKVTWPAKFREYWQDLFDAVDAHRPELILVSAGFDAHQKDPLTRIGVPTSTFEWLGQSLGLIAERHGAPIVCALEGGYHQAATEQSAKAFIEGVRTPSFESLY